MIVGTVIPQKYTPVYAFEDLLGESSEDYSLTDYSTTTDSDFDISQIGLGGKTIKENNCI